MSHSFKNLWDIFIVKIIGDEMTIKIGRIHDRKAHSQIMAYPQLKQCKIPLNHSKAKGMAIKAWANK